MLALVFYKQRWFTYHTVLENFQRCKSSDHLSVSWIDVCLQFSCLILSLNTKAVLTQQLMREKVVFVWLGFLFPHPPAAISTLLVNSPYVYILGVTFYGMKHFGHSRSALLAMFPPSFLCSSLADHRKLKSWISSKHYRARTEI